MQTDTGLGDFSTSQTILKICIDDHTPDIMIISEVYFKGTETYLDLDFPDYDIEANFMKI